MNYKVDLYFFQYHPQNFNYDENGQIPKVNHCHMGFKKKKKKKGS